MQAAKWGSCQGSPQRHNGDFGPDGVVGMGQAEQGTRSPRAQHVTGTLGASVAAWIVLQGDGGCQRTPQLSWNDSRACEEAPSPAQAGSVRCSPGHVPVRAGGAVEGCVNQQLVEDISLQNQW